MLTLERGAPRSSSYPHNPPKHIHSYEQVRWQHHHGPSLLIQAHDGPVVLAHEKHKHVFSFKTRLSLPFTSFTTVPSIALSILHQPPALGAGFTHYAKIRRFQLRSLHMRHAFPCTPISNDAKKYVLQNCSGDLVSFLRNCCGFGLPVPLYFAL